MVRPSRDLDQNYVSLFGNVPRTLEPVTTCTPPTSTSIATEGCFLRTYHRKTREVVLTAPADYSDFAFAGWRTRDPLANEIPVR